jgi:hypothetical protein
MDSTFTFLMGRTHGVADGRWEQGMWATLVTVVCAYNLVTTI